MYLGNDSAEKSAVEWLVKHLLSEGFALAVNDGQEWVVKATTEFQTIWNGMGETGEDFVRLSRNDKSCGTLMLIWGNGAAEMISDYGIKPETDAAAAAFSAQFPL